MRIAYFDPFSGASGDMILGALIAAGAPLAELSTHIARLGLPVAIRTEPVEQHGVRGLRAIVEAPEDDKVRRWADIRALIEDSSLPPAVAAQALAIFARLAEAEATVHGVDVDSVHFHEVGGLDAIADVCGACIALSLLHVEAVACGPLRVGSGFVRAAHGLLPVPAPATAELIARAGAPVSTRLPETGDAAPGELLTPTGAAILTTLATFAPVEFAPSAIGYGYGSRDLPWPNALRVFLGETTETPEPTDGAEIVLETNIDDMSPQHMELLVERLFAAGALDVWLTPVTMKKGRPGMIVGALAPAARRGAIEDAFIRNSTTLGVRSFPVARTKADRRMESVTTRWGDVRVKLRGWQGRIIDAAPEYDDCLRLARANDVSLREVWNEAHRMAESHIGRRLPPDPTPIRKRPS